MSNAFGTARELRRGGALDAARAGAAVVTANNRLARALQFEYGDLQRAAGAEAWATPAILPWNGWLDSIWTRLMYAAQVPVRLSPEQETLIWERIVRESPEAESLLSLTGTAEAARRAWALAQAWRLSLAEIEAEAGEDTRAWLRWACRFDALSKAENWLEDARVPELLLASLGAWRPPERLVLAGFDELTPQQLEFIQACEQAGAGVALLAPPQVRDARAIRVELPDRRTEITAAALWARTLLEAGGAGSIGVVLPDLAQHRSDVERIFTEILDPAAALAGGARRQGVFNISAGKPLAEQPLVRAAFLALELSPALSDLGRLGALLRSRFLAGGEGEASARARLDAKLRDKGNAQLPVSLVLRVCRKEQLCPALQRALAAWERFYQELPERDRAGNWAHAFSALLAKLGWPGENLSSEEYQAHDAWQRLLSAFARLDAVDGEFTRGGALARLRRMAAETMFQPEAENAPLQILGVLEASGAQFDHLWVAGLDDGSWPRPARPAAFLPPSLQRRKRMPRASADRELEFAQRETARLRACAPDVVLSHPQFDQDRPLKPSPLIAEVPPGELSLPGVAGLAEAVRAASQLEQFEDQSGPPVPEGAWSLGGTKVFQHQATCPFHAFAELRLGGKALEAPEDGLGPRDRGILVHEALEHIWKGLGSHLALRAATPEGLGELLRAALDEAVAAVEKRRGGPLPPRFASIERQRVEALLRQWLDLEKERQPFTVVGCEQDREVEFAGIKARVKIDRIDELPGGGHAVIDYKTGRPDPRNWEGERLSEPQVPLYAVTDSGEPVAALFAQVRTGELRFRGLCSDPGAVPGAAQADMPAIVAEWRRNLEQLGQAFREGRADTDPKDPQTCRRCVLAALCRIHQAEYDTSALTGERS